MTCCPIARLRPLDNFDFSKGCDRGLAVTYGCVLSHPSPSSAARARTAGRSGPAPGERETAPRRSSKMHRLTHHQDSLWVAGTLERKWGGGGLGNRKGRVTRKEGQPLDGRKLIRTRDGRCNRGQDGDRRRERNRDSESRAGSGSATERGAGGGPALNLELISRVSPDRNPD
ncbi:hypothetical protein EVAR_9401_1 [Eumeta japonica]|uniref:Uncharacterized protein n=1 Tax=Eumeta variegata TaxID=151549 RepID=A0A4C1UCT1_EUMVA|nr:hypothetical protein EVAR_9401_1 [Eumeta japonica]